MEGCAVALFVGLAACAMFIGGPWLLCASITWLVHPLDAPDDIAGLNRAGATFASAVGICLIYQLVMWSRGKRKNCSESRAAGRWAVVVGLLTGVAVAAGIPSTDGTTVDDVRLNASMALVTAVLLTGFMITLGALYVVAEFPVTKEQRASAKAQRLAARQKAAKAAARAEREAQRPKTATTTAKRPKTPARPKPMLIRAWRDAEIQAARWMVYFGYGDATPTALGPDGGIDIVSTKAIGQVKMHGLPIGRPEIQQLYGIAVAERKKAVFFALAGYTPAAIEWASNAGVALFQFDLQGDPEPRNDAASRLLPKFGSDASGR